MSRERTLEMSSSLLEPSIEDDQLFINRLKLESDPSLLSELSGTRKTSDGIEYMTLVPKPGFCVKTKTTTNEKIFINVCVADEVPEPKDLSEAELIKVLESDDPYGFRIPMSIGEPRAEVDKSGDGCTAYDVIIHPKFLSKVATANIFQAFFIQVMKEGIESKYELELSRDYVVLKNRKSIGHLQEQNVRKKSKPVIMDMDNLDQPLATQSMESGSLIQEVQKTEATKAPEPKFTLVQEPATGHPDFLVAEIHLPQIKTASSLTLDIGEDRILLETRSNVYHLDIFLPYNVVQEDVGAQFHRKNKILTITMPVQEVS